MGAQGRRSRSSEPRPSGQHFLQSRSLARELVVQAGISSDDLVVEIGAGTGRITEALALSARRVVAVELDPSFVRVLRRRFPAPSDVEVVEGDILHVPLPRAPFRAFGNVPFGLTTALLRRLLDDPDSALQRVDLIVQYGAARKRGSVWPSTLLSLGWLPWWEFALTRHLSASAFEPVPPVDAALLSVTRRSPPLLTPEQRPQYVSLVRAAFRRAQLPVSRSIRHRVPERAWRRLVHDRGIALRSNAMELDVFDWVALFKLSRTTRSSRSRKRPHR